MWFDVRMSKSDKSPMGDRLRHARKLRKLTQQQLANLAGVSQGLISNIESQGRDYGFSVLPIAKILRVSHDWLLLQSDVMEPSENEVAEERAAYSTLAAALQVLGDALQDMDPGTRRRVMSLIADLEVDPASHAQVAAAIEAMREITKNRRAA